MGEDMVELTAADIRQYLTAPIRTGQDLVRVRSMLGLSREVFAMTIGKSTKTVAKAEEASVLPTDIALLARGQMVTHISNVAADYMEELDLNGDSMLVMAQLFSERLLGGQKVISEHEFATLKELSEK